MKSAKHKASVIEKIQEEIKKDRAKIQIGDISKFGLLELSRQHLSTALHNMSPDVCKSCGGTGKILSSAAVVLTIVGRVEKELERIIKNKESGIEVVEIKTSLGVSDELNNNKRKNLLDLESKFSLKIKVLPTLDFNRMDYIVSVYGKNNRDRSYIIDTTTLIKHKKASKYHFAKPKISPFSKTKASNKGILSRLFGFIFGPKKPKYKKVSKDNNRGGYRGNKPRRSYPPRKRGPRTNNRTHSRSRNDSNNNKVHQQNRPVDGAASTPAQRNNES
jgi:ribonuclease E